MLKPIMIITGALVIAAAFFLGRWTATTALIHSPTAQALKIQTFTAPAAPTQTAAAHMPALEVSSSKTTTRTPLNQTPSYMNDLARLQALLELATTQPQTALAQAQQLRGALKTQAETQILAIWAGFDAYGAWHWLEVEQPEQTQARVTLLTAIARQQAQIAIDLAEQLAAAQPQMKKDIYLAAITGMSEGGAYDTAAFFIEYLELETEIKTDLMSALANTWALYQPDAALQWVMAQPQAFGTEALGRMGAAWAQTDPAGAANFAISLSDSAQKTMLRETFHQWLETDITAANQWLASMPTAPELDALISAGVLKASSNGAEIDGQIDQLLGLSARITNTKLRINTLISLFSPYKEQNPEAALRQINGLNYLSSSERQQLLQDLALSH